MKIKELMERKQGPHITFREYVSDMHNLHFKLKHKIAEDKFVELLKDNMNSQMGGLLLTSPITSLAELREKHKKKHAQPSGGQRNRGIPDTGGLAGHGRGRI